MIGDAHRCPRSRITTTLSSASGPAATRIPARRAETETPRRSTTARKRSVRSRHGSNTTEGISPRLRRAVRSAAARPRLDRRTPAPRARRATARRLLMRYRCSAGWDSRSHPPTGHCASRAGKVIRPNDRRGIWRKSVCRLHVTRHAGRPATRWCRRNRTNSTGPH